MHWGMNTQFLSWEACFNKHFKKKTWYFSGCFQSKACRANFLAKRSDAPQLHSLLKIDNQENLEWLSQREAGYFSLTIESHCACEIFRSWFSFTLRVESSDSWGAVGMIPQYWFMPGITPESSVPADIQDVPSLCHHNAIWRSEDSSGEPQL